MSLILMVRNISGIHHVYLVFTGSGSNYLFNVNWFTFIGSIDDDLTLDDKVNLEDVAELSADWQSGYTTDNLLKIAINWLYGATANVVGVDIDCRVDSSSGLYTMTWRYAVRRDAKLANLVINGTTVPGNIPFETAGSWADWDTQTVSVNMISGIKSVRLVVAGSSSLGNTDYMEITGPETAAASCN